MAETQEENFKIPGCAFWFTPGSGFVGIECAIPTKLII